VYAGQLQAGQDYTQLHPAFSICLVAGVLWRETPQLHHAFCLTDRRSGKMLDQTLEIHTLEFGKYNLREQDLAAAGDLERWLYWLIHAHEYEAEELLRLFPQRDFQQATRTITRIAAQTEDKSMYDAREKALRDQQWALTASRNEGMLEGEIKGKQEGILEGKQEGMLEGKREGMLEGEIKLIRTLQEILLLPTSSEADLSGKSLDELRQLAAQLQDQLRNRLT
jgi:hypothetical protein